MPSASFSTAIASRLCSHRNSLCVIGAGRALEPFESTSFATNSPSAASSSASSEGAIVRRSQPASSRISPMLRKLAPITTVL
ncbi:Uncharacterised protein [Vibrio cholerae]|uniref:Uncharacterized protein n=1 Tax=Vibrio cholerae TaxID=666 RepID=A0A656A6D1_VIBCL|nr:Uncharacterised protein [Vibrio cholerae]CSC94520.1 Uncharacterised protein [Vibrio cholerae]